MSLFIFTLAYMGFAGIALSMKKHYKAIANRQPPHSLRFLLRAGGWVVLLVSFWLALTGWQGGLGIVIWFGLLTLAAFLFTMLLTYQPRRAFYIIPFFPALGLMGLAF